MIELYLFIILLCILYRYVIKYKIFKIIILTIYFPVKKHHHNISRYIQWSKLFFSKVKCDIVFYTSYKYKYVAPNIHNIHTFLYNNITDIPIINKLKIAKMVKNKLFQIYHSKIALLYYTSIKYKANIYFFNDISTFHFKEVENITLYPNIDFITSLFGKTSSPILFTIQHNRHSPNFIQGGCFGGIRMAIKYLYDNYYSYLTIFFKQKGIVKVSEEYLLNLVIYNINDSILIPNNPNKCKIYDMWFYYVNVLSGYPKECVRNIKLSRLHDY